MRPQALSAQEQRMLGAALRSAAKFARRHRRLWWVDQDDLGQEAQLWVWKAREGYDHTRNDSPEAWASYISLRRLVNVVIRRGMRKFAPLRSASYAPGAEGDAGIEHGGYIPPPAALWAPRSANPERDASFSEVLERLESLRGTFPDADAGVEVLLGASIREVAEGWGLKESRVKAITERLRAAMRREERPCPTIAV